MALPSLTLLGQSLLSGLFIGALYGLLGLGLSLSWGMLRQINLAHFALAFLGAYLTYQLAGAGMDPLATLAVIVPCFFALGVLMHWLFARFSVSTFNSLLVSFGLTVIIEALIQWIWTADFRRMESAYGEARFRIGTLYVALPELLRGYVNLQQIMFGFILFATMAFLPGGLIELGRRLRGLLRGRRPNAHTSAQT